MKIFGVKHIEYNQPIGSKTFDVENTRNAVEIKEPQRLPDNEKYENNYLVFLFTKVGQSHQNFF